MFSDKSIYSKSDFGWTIDFTFQTPCQCKYCKYRNGKKVK